MVNEIKPRDMVYVAQDCCGNWIGKIFEVRALSIGPASVHCDYCKRARITLLAFAESQPGLFCMPLSWLRRIPPLWELDDVEHEEGIPA